MAPWDGFRFVRDVAPPRAGHRIHLHNLAIAELLFDARNTYMPNSTLQGDANLLVLPNIDAANIAYNLLKTAAGGNIAVGPILLGSAKPVHILTPSATVRRIVNMTALTVADANAAR